MSKPMFPSLSQTDKGLLILSYLLFLPAAALIVFATQMAIGFIYALLFSGEGGWLTFVILPFLLYVTIGGVILTILLMPAYLLQKRLHKLYPAIPFKRYNAVVGTTSLVLAAPLVLKFMYSWK